MPATLTSVALRVAGAAVFVTMLRMFWDSKEALCYFGGLFSALTFMESMNAMARRIEHSARQKEDDAV